MKEERQRTQYFIQICFMKFKNKKKDIIYLENESKSKKGRI